VEPLDGPITPEHLGGDYYLDRRHPVLTAFQTTFAGGNSIPAWVRVEAGKTTSIEPIKVPAARPGLNPEAFIWTTDFKTFQEWSAPIPSGRALYLLVAGKGLERVPMRGFTFSAPSIAIDASDFERDQLEDGTPLVIMVVWRGVGARPGAYSLYMAVDNERTLIPGMIEVNSP
jgi:hypothetical protein